MQHTPLVKVIQSLGARERADLMRWVESPFVNRREEVSRLCRYLCQIVPVRGATEEHSDALGKMAVYAKVFGSDSSGRCRLTLLHVLPFHCPEGLDGLPGMVAGRCIHGINAMQSPAQTGIGYGV